MAATPSTMAEVQSDAPPTATACAGPARAVSQPRQTVGCGREAETRPADTEREAAPMQAEQQCTAHHRLKMAGLPRRTRMPGKSGCPCSPGRAVASSARRSGRGRARSAPPPRGRHPQLRPPAPENRSTTMNHLRQISGKNRPTDRELRVYLDIQSVARHTKHSLHGDEQCHGV